MHDEASRAANIVLVGLMEKMWKYQHLMNSLDLLRRQHAKASFLPWNGKRKLFMVILDSVDLIIIKSIAI